MVRTLVVAEAIIESARDRDLSGAARRLRLGFRMAQPHATDFVNLNDLNDHTYESIGCATLFINYLRNPTGFMYLLDQIVQRGGSTLTRTYQHLTGNIEDPFPAFFALRNTKFPAGGQANWPDDNPFAI